MDNIKLAKKLKKHDEKALEEIMARFTPLVATIIYNISNGRLSTSDIEETVADTFISLWNNAESFQSENLKGYLCSIAKNKAKNKLRNLKSIQLVDIEDTVILDDFSVSENIENKEVNAELYDAINEIKEPDREIMIRHYYYYQSVYKIAEIMNINAETVKSKIRRARAKLKEYLEERGYRT